MKGWKAFFGLLVTLLCAALALAAPASDIAKRSLSSLARTSQLPAGQGRQHNVGEKRVFLSGILPFHMQDFEARRIREAALREALNRRFNRGDGNFNEEDNGIIPVLDKRNVAALARAGELRQSSATLNAKRNVAAFLRQSKFGAPASTEMTGRSDEEDEEAAFAGNPDDPDSREKRIPYGEWSERHLPDLTDEAASWLDYDEDGLSSAPAKRFLGRIPNMGRHRPQKQTSGGSGIKTSRRQPHSS